MLINNAISTGSNGIAFIIFPDCNMRPREINSAGGIWLFSRKIYGFPLEQSNVVFVQRFKGVLARFARALRRATVNARQVDETRMKTRETSKSHLLYRHNRFFVREHRGTLELFPIRRRYF